MLRIIEQKNQIKNYLNVFHEKLDSSFLEEFDCHIGYPGGSFDDTVAYSAEFDVWVSRFRHDKNYFYNGFGFGKPKDKGSNSLYSQINFATSGINRKLAAAFAIDENNDIFILHRGNIGGGKSGIGKSHFLKNTRCDLVTALDGDRESDFILIGDLNSKHVISQVVNFIYDVYRVKHVLESPHSNSFEFLREFVYTHEKHGISVSEKTEPRKIERTHGIIVNSLESQLQVLGYNTGSDNNRDLFIHKNGKVKFLFEVKSGASTQCLFSAIGQLLLYSIPISTPVKLVAVLPQKLSPKVSSRMEELGITLLYFYIKDKTVSFPDLQKVLIPSNN